MPLRRIFYREEEIIKNEIKGKQRVRLVSYNQGWWTVCMMVLGVSIERLQIHLLTSLRVARCKEKGWPTEKFKQKDSIDAFKTENHLIRSWTPLTFDTPVLRMEATWNEIIYRQMILCPSRLVRMSFFVNILECHVWTLKCLNSKILKFLKVFK